LFRLIRGALCRRRARSVLFERHLFEIFSSDFGHDPSLDTSALWLDLNHPEVPATPDPDSLCHRRRRTNQLCVSASSYRCTRSFGTDDSNRERWSNMLRKLELRSDPRPAALRPSRPMITYDKGLPSLPYDIVCDIFGFLDTETLKSCSLTGKALSLSAKPFIHRTLYLTYGAPVLPEFSGCWNEFKGLPILGERGLLQHIRHLSIFLRYNPLFAHDLKSTPSTFAPSGTSGTSRLVGWISLLLFPRWESVSGHFWGRCNPWNWNCRGETVTRFFILFPNF